MSFIVQPPDLSAYLPLAGGVLTGSLTIPDGAAATPSLRFTSDPRLGLFTISGIVVLNVNNSRGFIVASPTGTSNAEIGSIGCRILSGSAFSFSSSATDTGNASDVFLYRDASAILALRNLTAAQTFKVYGTTDAGLTNYERLAISAQQGVGFTIGAERLGTGADNLDITISPSGTGSVVLVGAANKISNNSAFRTGDATGTGHLYLDVSKLVLRRGDAVSNFSGLFFNAETVANVAMIPNGTIIRVRTGDDSAFGDIHINAARIQAVAFAALTAAATAGAGARATINNCSTVVFGAAADGAGALTVPVWSNGAAWLVG